MQGKKRAPLFFSPPPFVSLPIFLLSSKKIMVTTTTITSAAVAATTTSVILPFDAHNHVHMGATPPSLPLSSLSGMAVMSTRPKDFPIVLDIAAKRKKEEESQDNNNKVVIPCLGIHPWFLHELTSDDWEEVEQPPPSGDDGSPVSATTVPKWVFNLEENLLSSPSAVVGEIGLDNFHFDPISKELTCDMDTQIRALEFQLSLATKYQRPVSLHCVRSIGKIMDTLSKIRTIHGGQLPPRIYFHAFGGKAATVTQLIKSLEKKKKKSKSNKTEKEEEEIATITKVYFGFAPIINFESKNFLEVIKAVGLERLVLETDHEEAAHVGPSMELGVETISKLFGITKDELIQQTNLNSKDLYKSCWPSTTT